MFEHSIIRRVGSLIDIGLLAETLLFYNSTHLLLDGSSLIALAKNIPADDLRELITRRSIKLSYVQDNVVVLSTGAVKVHNCVTMRMGSTNSKRPRVNFKEEISHFLERELGRSRSTKRLSTFLCDTTKLHRFNGSNKPDTIPALACADFADSTFVRSAASIVLKRLVPNYRLSQGFRFELFDTGQGFAVVTDLDFDAINNIYHQSVPPDQDSITSARLLSHIVDARADTYFAAEYMAELVTKPVYGDICKLKHFDCFRRRDRSAAEIELFQDVVVPELPTVREAINSRQHTVRDFIILLDRADKFKTWLSRENPDATLLQSYLQAATAKTWADKLPCKSIRFSIAGGIGLAAELFVPTGLSTLAGLAVGAFDSLLLDKVLHVWRPNQFIEGPYREFLSTEGTNAG
jgi:hypothetical protein